MFGGNHVVLRKSCWVSLKPFPETAFSAPGVMTNLENDLGVNPARLLPFFSLYFSKSNIRPFPKNDNFSLTSGDLRYLKVRETKNSNSCVTSHCDCDCHCRFVQLCSARPLCSCAGRIDDSITEIENRPHCDGFFLNWVCRLAV